MELEEIPERIVKLKQESVPFTDRCKPGGSMRSNNSILIKLGASRAIGRRPGPHCPFTWHSPITDVSIHYWVNLPNLQRDASYRSSCTSIFRKFLSDSPIPEFEHAFFLDELFRVIDAAVSPDFSIAFEIWDMTLLEPVERKRVPATRESIEGLERVKLVELEDGGRACVICCADYDGLEQLVTMLSCSHYYHEDCILQWLHINHICPVCRFALPKED